MNRALLFAGVFLACVVATRAQGPTFEVAAIKENKSGGTGMASQVLPGGRYTATNAPLVRLIATAYGNPFPLQPSQVAAPPEPWMSSDRFDINAKGAGDATDADKLLMLQSLLRERFKLVMHREARPMSVLVLRLARSDGRLGPQLKPSTLNCESPEDKGKCGYRGNPERITAGAGKISQLAATLNILLRGEQLVIDQTGLDELYDLEVTYSGVPGRGAPPVDAEHPPLQVALEQQLGLTLSSERAPVDVWVIDSAQRPEVDD